MPEKIYFYLLIFCGIWSHSIIETFANEEIKESSDFLVRHKRVISEHPSDDNRVNISDVKHAVMIKYATRICCAGSIISNYVVITAATCIPSRQEEYKIISGSSFTYLGNEHDVIDVRKHIGIALLTAGQPFVYGPNCHNIELHSVPLLPGTIGQIVGWGYNWRGSNSGTNYPEHLRSIEVPIISHRECVTIYRPRIVITDKEVCTYHPQRHCGHTDFGTGLIIDGYLAGVHLWTGKSPGRIDPQYPDVFAILQHSNYSQWIRSNVRDIHVNYQHNRYP